MVKNALPHTPSATLDNPATTTDNPEMAPKPNNMQGLHELARDMHASGSRGPGSPWEWDNPPIGPNGRIFPSSHGLHNLLSD